jgi:hypothetical protein
MTAVTAIIQDATAGEMLDQAPTVVIRDLKGAPVSGISVLFSDDAPDTRPYATTTGEDGTARFAWFAGRLVGVEHLTATTQGVPNVGFVANVHAAPPTLVAAASETEQVSAAGATLPSSPTIHVTDRYANPTPGAKVIFTLDGPGAASIANPEAITDVYGIATAGAWTLGSQAGEYTVTATIQGTAIAPFVFTARINTPFPVMTIAAGGSESCAVGSSGGTYCWGYMAGTVRSATTPTLVGNLPPLVSLAVGDAFACGLTSAGAAYCWGVNASGQLGKDTFVDDETPRAVAGGLAFTSLVAGASFVCGLTTSQVAYCWGDNLFGQLGDTHTTNRAIPAPVFTTEHFTTMAAGYTHVCAVATTGTTYCWGANDAGQLGAQSADVCLIPGYDYYGYGTTTVQATCATKPIAVRSAPEPFTALVASSGTCGLLASGQPFCWGYSGPGAIPNIGQFTSLAAANGGVCGITTTQSIACWTYASNAQPPSILSLVPGVAAPQRIVAGDLHWCAIDGAGIAFCWGDNREGQLGNGTHMSVLAPLTVSSP